MPYAAMVLVLPLQAGDCGVVVDRPRTTPLRTIGVPDDAGYVLLRDVGSSYRDGAEAKVLATLEVATDLRSDSDELIGHASGWAQRYHLDPARANVVRCLDLPAGARILEVGAGCGAVSRYLGETGATVDALEPVPARAAAAAARTADLPNVTVFVGDLDDVPDLPAYDVIVVIGVLEYIGAGSADAAPYRRFLRQVAARLVDGGSLVLAIENRLGVKYLVGAPEDHTGRFFDSIESYPVGGHARTFHRPELEAMVHDAGLQPLTLGAFPDYKLTRVLFDDFPDAMRSLFYRIPRFPSPDWSKRRPQLADEYSLWRNLVDAGMAREFANSFVVLAGKGSRTTLWPSERRAVFHSDGRRAALTTRTFVEQQGAEIRFRRQLAAPDRRPEGCVTMSVGTAPFQPGTDLCEVITEAGLAGAEPHVKAWLVLLDDALRSSRETAVDVIPQNLILSDDGVLHRIDEELVIPDVSREQIVRRGIYLLARQCALASPPARWAPCTTVGELMVALGVLAGLPADGSWLDQHVDEESRLQAGIRAGRPAGSTDDQWLETIKSGMRGLIAKRLTDLPLGDRLPARYTWLTDRDRQGRAALQKLQADGDGLRGERDRMRAEVRRLSAELAECRERLRTPRIEVPASALRLAARALPSHTARGRAARRIWRAARNRAGRSAGMANRG